MLKDILEYRVRRDFTNNIGKVMDALAEILGDKVAGEVYQKAVLVATNGVEGADEGFVMTDVGHNDIVLRYLGEGCGFYQQCL